ncbi:membrane protein [Litorihabitans aurantiacus]|uniref:Membrane protein n=1 Tax=Litorihabitans aurantiacus TaxID=1930061 RepID=A0AA38CUW6_9MICO|nr:membrane protein [Litorihabitans aurantiacus]
MVGLGALAVAVVIATTGPSAPAVTALVLLLAAAWLVSPLLYPRSPAWADALERSRATGAPIVLWKPGCAVSVRLRLALGPAGRRAVWVDAWADDDAMTELRRVNDGDETTPTALTAAGARTNPPPSWVRAQLP